MNRAGAGGVTVIGIGNRFRRDDAAGLEVARRVRMLVDGDVRILELEGEPIDALDVWTAADEVILADAVAGTGAAGTVHLLDASEAPIPAPFRVKGTHAFSLADVVELARATELLPRSLVVYGIEGGDFSTGEGLTEPVARAVEDSVTEIVRRVGTR
ncbi:MAG TPA: hydrogenase maturation protease [Actinomycetota bacterium]